MRRRFTPLVLLFAALLTLGMGSVARAQDATPAASPSAASGCTIEPRSMDEMLALWFNETGTPAATPAAQQAPDAEIMNSAQPADAATADAVKATMTGFIACSNAGDFPRMLAYLTDQFAATFGPAQGVTKENAQSFLEATPQAVPAEAQVTLASMEAPIQLADGRVASQVTVNDPSSNPSAQRALVYFRQVDGKWLIDAFVETSAPATPEATPAS